MSKEQLSFAPTTAASGLPISENGDALVTISHAHEELHKGNFYNVSEIASVPASGFKYWLIQANTPLQVHLSMNIATEAASVIVRIFETPDVTAVGTALMPTNSNRNDPDTPQPTITTDPTFNTKGLELGLSTLIPSGATGGGNASGAVGAGPVRGDTELILADSTDYLLEVENLATTPDTISINVAFYQHPVV